MAKILGITGNIGSGKSTVAAMFERLGAFRLDADAAGHEALKRAEIVDALRRRWGDAVLNPDGSASRRAVAEIVFAPTEQGRREHAFLEALVHPVIAEIMQEKLGRQAAAEPGTVAVLDAPLLFEAGWDRMTEGVVYVDCPEAICLERARARGWSEHHFRDRLARQMSPEEKRRRSRWTVSTFPQTREETAEQVADVWKELSNAAEY